MSSSFSSRGISTAPSEISTCVSPSSPSQSLYSSTLPRAQIASKNVPPMTTRLPASTSSLRFRFGVTYAVPQPSLTTSMYSPLVSSTSSQARGPSPLSRTCVSPPSRGGRSKAGNDVLQPLGGLFLDVVEERVAVRVDPHPQRPEILDAEAPEALGHELLPGDLFDLLDLRRLEGRRAADDREIHHPVAPHRLDCLIRQSSLAGDRADAVVAAEPLGEPHHPRARRRADGDLLVAARTELPNARRGVQEERAAQLHRRLVTLVEDPDVRAVPDPDDVPVHGHEVAGLELANVLLGRRKCQPVFRHYASRSNS